METLTAKVINKFKKLIFDTEDCIEWEFSTNDSGYGRIRTSTGGVSKNYLVHRVSFIVFIGVIPENLFVLHSCDNRLCINPKHLFLGTIADNNLDRQKKGRTVLNVKSAHKAKLLASKISHKEKLFICSQVKSGIKQTDLAKQFNVSDASISLIVNNKIRKLH